MVPALAVAPNATVPLPHLAAGVVAVIDGVAVIVIFLVTAEQFDEAGGVYVIVATPALMPSITPVEELIVAIVASEDDQVPPVTSAEKVEVAEPTQPVIVPDNVTPETNVIVLLTEQPLSK